MKLQHLLLKLLTISHRTVSFVTTCNRFIAEGKLHETTALTTENVNY
jgi:hypothetical protein